MLRNLALVGFGGMAGSIARYLVAVALSQRLPLGFPFGTFTVNIVGCFLIGLILGLLGRAGTLGPDLRLLLATGFCGGFTTFSSFTYEIIELVEANQAVLAVFYVTFSILLGLLAAVAGLALTR
ncbi:MAG: putative fluoride ion transporter CrcB [Candidatus Kapaibacterium sp.]|nr:MAG: putative fluoride ion transporter CrcB [Candidatus Kapabacteria bacterium]